MGTIIHLNPLPKVAAPIAAGAPLPECEIVIFPGVRIEREEPRFAAEVHDPRSDGSADNGHRPRKSS